MLTNIKKPRDGSDYCQINVSKLLLVISYGDGGSRTPVQTYRHFQVYAHSHTIWDSHFVSRLAGVTKR